MIKEKKKEDKISNFRITSLNDTQMRVPRRQKENTDVERISTFALFTIFYLSADMKTRIFDESIATISE